VESDAFVFVGYSFSDPDIRSIFMRFRDALTLRSAEERDVFVVSPCATDEEFAVGKAIWSSRGAVWIPLSAETFFRNLVSVLEQSHLTTKRQELMSAYDLADDQSFDDKVAQIANLLKVDKAAALELMRIGRRRVGGGL
jgi:predicted NodU family carbamoyl transferase